MAAAICAKVHPVDLLMNVMEIKDVDKNVYKIFPVNSFDELNSMPKELNLDYRLIKEDNFDTKSYLHSFSLDHNFTRSKLFIIKKDKDIIGVFSVFCIPQKKLKNYGYLYLKDHKLYFKSLDQILDLYESDFVLEFGWFQLVKEFQKKHIGVNILNNIFIPLLKDLISAIPHKLVIFGSVKGQADFKIKNLCVGFWEKREKELVIDEEEKKKLGKTHINSKFSLIMGKSLHFNFLDNVFNFSFGPVFFKKLDKSVFC
jgi:hypothetical protein